MNGLIRINSTARFNHLRGFFGRIEYIEGERGTVLIEVESACADKFHVPKYRLPLSVVDLITDGEQLITERLPLKAWNYLNKMERASAVANGLCIEAWQYLSADEKAGAVKGALQSRLNEYYAGFERIQLKEPAFLDAFIVETRKRFNTHYHFGVKAIFEEMRYDSDKKDQCAQFKINNNYTASMSLLMIELFPELNGFFERRPRKLEAA